MARIFISYKRADKEIVFPLKDKIEAAIGERCWIDLTGIESDAQFAEVIMKNIDACSVFLFMYSKRHSQINNYTEDWTVREIHYALKRKKRIVFVNIDDYPLEGWLDLMFPWKQETKANSPEEMALLYNNLKTWLSDNNNLTSKSETYSVRFSIDETCELYIDEEKRRKLKGGHQSIVDGFETKKKYHISFRSLARTNSVIDVDYIQTSLAVPNQVFDLNISFAEQRQKEEEEEIAKRQAAKLEKEKEREREELVFQVLQGYDEFSYLYYGFYIVRKGRLYGYVDEMGFETIPCIYEKVSVFKNGHATVCKNGKWGIIDEYGQIVIDMQSDCPCWQIGNYQYFVFGNQGRYAITTFEVGIPTIFPYLEVAFIENHENYVWVRDENGWRLISLTGDSVPFCMTVNEIETRHAGSTDVWDGDNEDKIKICQLPMRVQNIQSGRWGYLNSQLKLSIPFVNESSFMRIYRDNLEYIQTNNKKGVADVEKGTFVIPCKYDEIQQVWNCHSMCNEPFFHVADNLLRVHGYGGYFDGGKQGILDIQGNTIVPMIFQYIMLYFIDTNNDCILYRFICLQAPDMKLLDNGLLDFNLHNASIHIYDLEGKLVETIPYLSSNNTYYDWGLTSKDIQDFAEEGSAEAQYDLGYDYYYQDIEQAVKWFRKAAQQGHARAQFQLGEIYYYGKEGVKKDFDEAIKWFKLAAKQGHEEAIKYLQKHYIDY